MRVVIWEELADEGKLLAVWNFIHEKLLERLVELRLAVVEELCVHFTWGAYSEVDEAPEQWEMDFWEGERLFVWFFDPFYHCW